MYKRPNPGDIVTVATKNRSTLLDKEFDYSVYEDVTVLEPFPWLSSNEFCIPAENEPYIKERVINMRSVVILEIRGKATNKVTEHGVHYVDVPGSKKGNEYSVRIEDGIGNGCGCLGFQYRGRCRHLKEGETIFAELLTR